MEVAVLPDSGSCLRFDVIHLSGDVIDIVESEVSLDGIIDTYKCPLVTSITVITLTQAIVTISVLDTRVCCPVDIRSGHKLSPGCCLRGGGGSCCGRGGGGCRQSYRNSTIFPAVLRVGGYQPGRELD